MSRITNLPVTVQHIHLNKLPSRHKEGYVSLEVVDNRGNSYITEWGVYPGTISVGTQLHIYEAEVIDSTNGFPILQGIKFL